MFKNIICKFHGTWAIPSLLCVRVCVFVFKKRKRIICIFQPNLSKAIAHWLLVRGQKWGKKNVWRRKKKRQYVSLCQNFTRRAVLSSFFLYKSLDSNEILLFVCLMFEMNSDFSICLLYSISNRKWNEVYQQNSLIKFETINEK